MQKFHKSETSSRIKLLRTKYAGARGKSDFARQLGISPSTYSYYEKNRVPPGDVLLKICQLTGTDIYWLLTGQSSTEIAPVKPKKPFLDKLEYVLNQNPELAEPISAFVELLCEKKGIENIQPTPEIPPYHNRPGWIPVLGRTAAGIVHFWQGNILPNPKQAVTELDELVKKYLGKTIISSADTDVTIDLQKRPLLDSVKNLQVNLIQVSGQQADQITEFVQCENIFTLFPDSFALYIDGDSMSPRVNDGDIVILSPSVPAEQGQIAVAHFSNQIGVTCKLIRMAEEAVHLIPINERYETKVVAKKELLWALAVICHLTT
ncbi:MAG: helix-turn-helix domain-containing protein [Sedimentisphaerales bacterium]|nr:helix-turn-helix domain-containing protein [Sedimentisphaerales bacterium]